MSKSFLALEMSKLLGLVANPRHVAILLLVVATLRPFAGGENVKTLYNFLGGSDGAYPGGGLVRVSDGFYGTTTSGGAFNQGIVYKLTAPAVPGAKWTESVLYDFSGGVDGGLAYGSPIVDKNGVIYGVTLLGGQLGQGTVFSLTPPQIPGGAWRETVLYSFQGGNDGAVPESGVVFDKFGALYGSTVQGGNGGVGVCYQGCGTVFQLLPPSNPGDPWTENVLYRFQGSADGGMPGGVTFGKHGALYGTTSLGGANRFGVVYRVKQRIPGGPWKQQTIYDFVTGDAFTLSPQRALTLDKNGVAYGPRQKGGDYGFGFVFQLAPPAMPGGSWTFTQLYSFTGGYDGLGPDASVTLDSSGTVFGTTGVGGRFGYGVVFTLTPGSPGNAWTETVLHTFAGLDGGDCISALLLDGPGHIYGVGASGGLSQLGTVFELLQ